MKFLTGGENTVDIDIVNAMIPKYKEKLEAAQRRMEEAKAKMEKEKDAAQNAAQEVAIFSPGRRPLTRPMQRPST